MKDEKKNTRPLIFKDALKTMVDKDIQFCHEHDLRTKIMLQIQKLNFGNPKWKLDFFTEVPYKYGRKSIRIDAGIRISPNKEDDEYNLDRSKDQWHWMELKFIRNNVKGDGGKLYPYSTGGFKNTLDNRISVYNDIERLNRMIGSRNNNPKKHGRNYGYILIVSNIYFDERKNDEYPLCGEIQMRIDKTTHNYELKWKKLNLNPLLLDKKGDFVNSKKMKYQMWYTLINVESDLGYANE